MIKVIYFKGNIVLKHNTETMFSVVIDRNNAAELDNFDHLDIDGAIEKVCADYSTFMAN